MALQFGRAVRVPGESLINLSPNRPKFGWQQPNENTHMRPGQVPGLFFLPDWPSAGGRDG